MGVRFSVREGFTHLIYAKYELMITLRCVIVILNVMLIRTAKATIHYH